MFTTGVLCTVCGARVYLISGSPQTTFGRIGEWASGNLQPWMLLGPRWKILFITELIVFKEFMCHQQKQSVTYRLMENIVSKLFPCGSLQNRRIWLFQMQLICDGTFGTLLYTALNSPSLIFALKRCNTHSPSLEFAHSQIFLHIPLYRIQLAQF